MFIHKNQLTIIIVVIIIAVGVGGYLLYKQAYSTGYTKAEADIKAAQEEVAKRAAGEIAKTANPFGVGNPLEGVEANPFEKTKDVLNPFGP